MRSPESTKKTCSGRQSKAEGRPRTAGGSLRLQERSTEEEERGHVTRSSLSRTGTSRARLGHPLDQAFFWIVLVVQLLVRV